MIQHRFAMGPPCTLRRFAEPVDLARWEELHEEARRLEMLVLHACSLDTLTGLPTVLPMLTELNLSSNNLTGFFGSGGGSVGVLGGSRVWTGMANLKKLDLSSNRMRGSVFLPNNISGGLGGGFFPALELLLVPYNAISSLEGISAVAPKLQGLDARSNRLRSAVEALQQLRALPVLQRLDLRGECVCPRGRVCVLLVLLIVIIAAAT